MEEELQLRQTMLETESQEHQKDIERLHKENRALEEQLAKERIEHAQSPSGTLYHRIRRMSTSKPARVTRQSPSSREFSNSHLEVRRDTSL